jgi:3-dehydroquinate dehydratase / shikimate dehydrogenase
MSQTTHIAVPITRADPPPAEQVEAAARGGADLVELRVDSLGEPRAVEAFLRGPRRLPVIVTVRSPSEGGLWRGSESERITLLKRLARFQPDYLDVELATWERSAETRRCLNDLKRPNAEVKAPRLILSHHDFQDTPADLTPIFRRLEATPADVIKAVFTPRDATDACRLLAELRRLYDPGRRAIVLGLGEAGLLTRVLAKKFGAYLTFAALEPGAESAPGQPAIAELRDVYRWPAIDARTRVYGVIGWPVSHSRGPRLHNAFMAAEGINGVYLPLPVEPTYAALAAFLDYATAADWLDFAGFSVTIPHKEHVLRWLAEHGGALSPLAQRAGAINTLIRTPDGGWRGENTDAAGALAALRSIPELAERPGAEDPLCGMTVDILGAGGVARAVAALLTQRGGRVTIYNRDPARAAELARQMNCDWCPWDRRAAGEGRVLINCTSVGMSPDVDASPIDSARFRPDTIVFDTIYNPVETRFLREAQSRGCRVIGGLVMYRAQAAEQMRLWHGLDTDMEWLTAECQDSDATP